MQHKCATQQKKHSVAAARYKKNNMTIEVLAFGIVKDIFGRSSMPVELDEPSVAALKKLLEQKYPRLKQIASYMIAVNNEYAGAEQPINMHDEVAIIPPVSGG